MNIKLICADLDGTLLRSDKTISERTLKMLEECRRKNIMIAIATARSENASVKYIDEIRPDIIISNGGAKVRCFGKIILKKIMSAETVKGIIDLCIKYSGGKGEITVETDNGYYWNYKEKPDLNSDYGYAIYSDFSDFCFPAYKITAELEMEEQAQKIVSYFPECSTLSFTGESWRRFALKCADKINAVLRVSEYLNIDVSQIAAFGDDYIDIDMLKFCGIGVAMDNAVESAKTAADFITCSNDDEGVAKFIEEKIF